MKLRVKPHQAQQSCKRRVTLHSTVQCLRSGSWRLFFTAPTRTLYMTFNGRIRCHYEVAGLWFYTKSTCIRFTATLLRSSETILRHVVTFIISNQNLEHGLTHVVRIKEGLHSCTNGVITREKRGLKIRY